MTKAMTGLYAGLTMLLLATSASAECAWVLWSQTLALAPAAAPGIDQMQRTRLSWGPERAYKN